MLAEGFGKNVQEGGFPIDSLGGVELQQSRTGEDGSAEGVGLAPAQGRPLPARPRTPG